jgi:hypothetical protein
MLAGEDPNFFPNGTYVGFACVLCALKGFVGVHLDLFRADPGCKAC